MYMTSLHLIRTPINSLHRVEEYFIPITVASQLFVKHYHDSIMYCETSKRTFCSLKIAKPVYVRQSLSATDIKNSVIMSLYIDDDDDDEAHP